MADRPARTSRYAQVAAELREAILSGRLAAGTPLPSEDRLAARHDVSRDTIRSALAVLRSEGLITTVQGGATYIRDRRVIRLPLSRYSRTLTSTPGPLGPFTATAQESGLTGSVEVISAGLHPADADTARRLEIPEGAEVIIRVRHMKLGDTEPETVQESTSTIPADLIRGSPIAGPGKVIGGLYAALAALGHIPTLMTEEVAARIATPEEAATLGLALGMPVFVIHRVTRDQGGRPIELLKVVATADRALLVYEDLPITPAPAG